MALWSRATRSPWNQKVRYHSHEYQICIKPVRYQTCLLSNLCAIKLVFSIKPVSVSNLYQYQTYISIKTVSVSYLYHYQTWIGIKPVSVSNLFWYQTWISIKPVFVSSLYQYLTCSVVTQVRPSFINFSRRSVLLAHNMIGIRFSATSFEIFWNLVRVENIKRFTDCWKHSRFQTHTKFWLGNMGQASQVSWPHWPDRKA